MPIHSVSKPIRIVISIIAVALITCLGFLLLPDRTAKDDHGGTGHGTALQPPPSLFSEPPELRPERGQAPLREAAQQPHGPDITKPRPREVIVEKNGRRLERIDPLASWNELPPWPEGPQLFAEVSTSTRLYVNLRPNDAGMLPMLEVGPEEDLQITLSMPESEPGQTVYLELPNGGSFPDISGVGRKATIASNRTVSLSMKTDETRGHCTLHIRQGSHTRTLPLWIGAPEEIASDDPS